MDDTGADIATEFVQDERCVYIVDDDLDIRRSLHFMLTNAQFKPRSFGVPQDFLEELAHLAPGPILLDIRMPGIDGLEVLEILNRRDIKWPVIMITAHGDVPTAVRAIKLGAMDFIEKPFVPEVLGKALGQANFILEQSVPSWRSRDAARQVFAQLSRRESEVLALLMEGFANKQVAHSLQISVRTVEEHRHNGLAKLGVKSVAEVVTLAATAELGSGTSLSELRMNRQQMAG